MKNRRMWSKSYPSKSPVLYPNVNCGIYNCDESKYLSWAQFYYVMGNCVKNPRDCQKIEFDGKDKHIKTIYGKMNMSA